MAIASVVQGLIETEDGKIFELDSPKGSIWLESASSFRYEPIGANKPYTVRQETKKGGDYWYGYRKVAGRLHKKYIGKSSELSTAKLEEIGEALNTPQQPRVTQGADTVTQITEVNNQQVTSAVTDSELTALRHQVQALQEAVKALQDVVLGKPEKSNFGELPKPNEGVTDDRLLTELGNLRAENEALRQELAKQKQDCDAQIATSKQFHRESEELRSQLETVQAELFDAKAIISSLDSSPVASALRLEIGRLQTELENCRQQAATEFDLPEAADLLNQLKTKRKKSSASLADVELILEMMEES